MLLSGECARLGILTETAGRYHDVIREMRRVFTSGLANTKLSLEGARTVGAIDSTHAIKVHEFARGILDDLEQGPYPLDLCRFVSREIFVLTYRTHAEKLRVLVRGEPPRLCRGGSSSSTVTGVRLLPRSRATPGRAVQSSPPSPLAGEGRVRAGEGAARARAR